MAIDIGVIGKPLNPLIRKYDKKDIILYALGVGAGFSELNYCYEKNLKALPTFLMSMIFDFFFLMVKTSCANPAGILHGEQDLFFHAAIPLQGTLITNGKISCIYDKGEKKGALIIGESETVHSNGEKLMTAITTIFSRLDGGFGGRNAPTNKINMPDCLPDFTVDDFPSKDQPLLYRLSGDYFALHVDPEFAQASGFEKPIMHGQCTQGFACRALIRSLIPEKPENVTRISCRYLSPLYPGTPIKTLIWKIDTGKALWKTINAETNSVVISNGIFEFKI